MDLHLQGPLLNVFLRIWQLFRKVKRCKGTAFFMCVDARNDGTTRTYIHEEDRRLRTVSINGTQVGGYRYNTSGWTGNCWA